VRVLLADLPGPARRALAEHLERLEGVELAGQAESRSELALALRRVPVDILVIDDRLLGDGDPELLGRVPVTQGMRMIVVGVDDDPAFARRAWRLGAAAWIAKDRVDEDLMAHLEAK
jgi:DNA-binding NarL/FixJ family response regulator